MNDTTMVTDTTIISTSVHAVMKDAVTVKTASAHADTTTNTKL